MAAGALKKQIAKEGQRYFDQPISIFPKRPTQVSAAISHAFGATPPSPIIVGHERVRLRWMKPDGKGGLVPK